MGAITVDNVFYPTPGTVPPNAIPVPAVNDKTVLVAGDPGVNNRKGIVVWMHPSQNSDIAGLPQVQTMARDTMAVQDFVSSTGTAGTGLTGIGWVTVIPKQPVDYSKRAIGYSQSMANHINSDTATNGTQLVNVYRAWFRKLCLYLKRKYHVANPPIIVFGYSLGAWVAAIIAANETASIVGYGCHCLPTEWDQLWQSPLASPGDPFKGVNCAGANLGASLLSGVSIPGIIGHSESPPGTYTDEVVGWTSGTLPPSNGSLIAASAGGNFTSYASSSASPDHIFSTTDATEYVNWISGTSPFSGYSATF